MHAKRKCPIIITTVLLPYVLQAVLDSHNILSLDKDGCSPIERLSGTQEETILTYFHTWGCPVFILEAENQSGGIGTPTWNPRSHTGMYLGHSPCHSGSGSLVLNLKTGLASPQFHIIFDDEFTTVPYLSSSDPGFPNRKALNKHSTKNANECQFYLAISWLYHKIKDQDQTFDKAVKSITDVHIENVRMAHGVATLPTQEDNPKVVSFIDPEETHHQATVDGQISDS